MAKRLEILKMIEDVLGLFVQSADSGLRAAYFMAEGEKVG